MATEKAQFTVKHLVNAAKLSQAVISPDAKWVVYVVKKWNEQENKSTASLWISSTNGQVTKRLTNAKFTVDFSPVWLPDSQTVLFLSTRSGTQQVWAVRIDGGEAYQVTNLEVDVDSFKVSPTTTHLVISAKVFPDAPTIADSVKRTKEQEKNPVKAMKFDKLYFRRWDQWHDGRASHLFAIPLTSNGFGEWKAVESGAVDLLKGLEWSCPVPPFGGSEDYDIAPDGNQVAFSTITGDDIAWSTNLDIYLVPIDGSAPPVVITGNNKATDKHPVYSKDGQFLYYLAMKVPKFESDKLTITQYNRKTNQITPIADVWDKSAHDIVLDDTGSFVYTIAEDKGHTKIYKVEVGTGVVTELPLQHHNTTISISHDTLAYLQDSYHSPAELWVASLSDPSKQTLLTHFNDELLKDVVLAQPDEFWFTGAGGDKVHSWLFKPTNFDESNPDKKYPVVMIIHGGPQGALGDNFHYRWNLLAFAAAGYGVIGINFHGSTGYGQKFTDSITGDWGGKPFEDIMKGLDYALATYPWMDPNRVGAAGASYGGYMINWINGQTDRFKCLVNHDGVFGAGSLYYTTEELFFPEFEFGGTPWESPELYNKYSPSNFVKNWKTPTLVIHGGLDYRVCDLEGMATFTVLQRKGIPSQLLYFPDENHWVLKPKNSILWYETVLAWLDRWLK